METPEQFAARQAKERAAFERKQAFAASLPIPPRFISSEESRVPVASYKVQTLAEALDIFRACTVIPVRYYSGGTFAHVMPAEFMKPRDIETATRDLGPFACWVRVSTRENGTADASLKFYARTPAGPVQVWAGFGADYIGACNKLAAKPETIREGSLGKEKIVGRKFHANPEARAMSDEFISWGTYQGAVPTYAEQEFLFTANQESEMLGADHGHALGMLGNLADALGV